MGNTFPTIKLNDGTDFPVMGFGVAGLNKGEILINAVNQTLEEGYRFFDTAPFYGNEKEIGEALRGSGYKREDYFLSGKLPNDCHAYNDAINAFHKTRELMGMDYLDMYLIHHPMPMYGKYLEAWKALEDLHDQGYIRVIGLSNFKENHIDNVLAHCNIAPATNELERNPYFTIEGLRKHCEKNKIRVITWFPLGGPLNPPPPIPPRPENFIQMLKDETLNEIGAKYGKTAAQITLRWHVDSGMTPVPKSGNPKRIHENADIFDFELTAEDLARIDALNMDRRLGPDPEYYDELSPVAMDV